MPASTGWAERVEHSSYELMPIIPGIFCASLSAVDMISSSARLWGPEPVLVLLVCIRTVVLFATLVISTGGLLHYRSKSCSSCVANFDRAREGAFTEEELICIKKYHNGYNKRHSRVLMLFIVGLFCLGLGIRGEGNQFVFGIPAFFGGLLYSVFCFSDMHHSKIRHWCPKCEVSK